MVAPESCQHSRESWQFHGSTTSAAAPWQDSTEDIGQLEAAEERRNYHSIRRVRFGPPGVLALPRGADGVAGQL